MKRLSLLFFVTLGAGMLVVSCKQGDKSNIMAPKDAALVMHLSNSSLSSKLSWQEIKATNWFKEAYSESPDSLLRKLLDDPDNSGMDTKADMLFYMHKMGRGNYFAFTGTLKDAAAFEAFNKKVSNGAAVSKDGEASFMNLKDEAIVSWKGSQFVYMVSIPDVGGLGNLLYRKGSYSEPYRIPVDSLKSIAKSSFEIKGSNSIGSDKRFAELIKEPGDMHFWINNEYYLSALGLGGDMLGMMKAGDLLKGNVSATTFNFENGKITMKSKSYLNEQLASLYKKFPPKKISADVINRIPSENVVGVIAMNYSPEGLKELIKLTGLDGLSNDFLYKAGYSIDEFVKANKGEMLISFSDLEIKKKEMTIPGIDGSEPYKYTTTQPDVKVLFATSVNDKAAFDKLIAVLSKEVPKEGAGIPEISYQINKEWFVAGNSNDFVNKFVSGNGSKQPFVDKLTGSNFGMFVDLQKVIKSLQNPEMGEREKQSAEASLKVWQDILITSGGFSDGSVSSYGEVNMVDKSVNSLKQLNQYIDAMAGINKRNRGNTGLQDAPVLSDTAATVAPPSIEK